MTREDAISDKLAAIVAEGPLPMLKLSPSGRLLYANPASQPLLRVWGVSVGNDAPGWCMDKIETVLAGCPSVSWEEQIGERCLSLTLRKGVSHEGLFLHGADITDYKTLLGEYARARDTAENANRAKSLFLSRMSHEIRTPLNTIVGMLQLVRHNRDTGKQRDYLRNIETASRHLMSLVSNILDLSRIESGKIELASEDFDLEKVVANAVGVIAPQAADKEQDIRLEWDYDIPQLLHGDPIRLSQVLVNLLSNALKFTPAKYWIKLAIKLLERNGDHLRIQFSVTDCGIGLDMSKASQIFEPFEQADGSIAKRFGGSGLGLAISRHLVELMGGNIGVQSVPSRGSTFSFHVLLRASGTLSDTTAGVWSIAGKNVLVADGDKYNRFYLLDMLSRKGAAAVACCSGREALKRVLDISARSQQFDLVLIGRKLNDMHPLKISSLVRQMNARSKILLMTNPLEWEQYMAQAKEVGLDGHIQLPVLPSTLQAAMLRNERVAAQAEEDEWCPDGIFEGKRVLVAEDNDLSRLMMQEVLSPTGAKLTIAENGLQAVNRVVYEKQDYDLILMDLQMPEMDGQEAARIIRSRRKDVYIPIIALTANAFADDMKTSLNSGMDGFLTKPLDISTLLETMKRVFAGGPLQSVVPQPQAVQESPCLDTAAGLKRLMNNVPLYRRMLLRTLEDKPSEELKRQYDYGDREAAMRVLHTLKGTAATLGLMALSDQAALMESTMKLGEDKAMLAMAPQLQDRLQDAHKAIRRYLSGAD